MAWLLRKGDVLASLDIAPTSSRMFCSVSCDAGAEATVFMRPIRIVHTLGAASRVDVAYLNEEHVVIDIGDMGPFRLNVASRSTKAVLRAPAGSFDRWALHCGDQLEVRP